MISNTAQINTFVGGLNLDTDVNIIPDNQYRYALDVRVVTNDGGTTGVLQSIENPRKYSTAIPEDETIIGTTTINDIAVIITKISDGTNKIYRIRDFDAKTPQVKVVCKGKLGLCEDLRKTPVLSIVGNYESDTNIKIYFTDGKSQVKVLNIMDTRYFEGSNSVDADGNIINPGALDITPSALLSPLKFVKLQTGNLESGVVTYCYLLFTVHHTDTATSALSELIHLTDSNTNSGSQKYKGMGLNRSANKAVVLQTDLKVNDFNKARIIRIHYTKNNSTPTIVIVDEIDITPNQTKLVYVDRGTSYLSELSVDEFNALTGYQFIAQTLADTHNRLFAANITEQSWVPKDSEDKPYDARAYRANSDGSVKLLSGSNDKTLEFKLSDTDQLNRILQTHDCINPFNSVSFGSCQDSEKYIYGKDGVLGGYGINIEYLFVTTDIKLSVQLKDYRLDLDCTMNVPAEVLNSIQIKKQDGTVISIDGNTTDYLKNPIIPNYADPYIDAKLRGYQRDEVYRFGIVFYNDKNVTSPVLWIGDIRMPHSQQLPPFVYENNTLIGKALGIEFTVKNMPKDAISYEIVRCDRTESDRTVVMQAVGSLIHEYAIQERDGNVGEGGELQNSVEMRPMPFFCSIAYDIGITTDNAATGKAPKKSLCKDYVRLVSPEICVLGEEIELSLKDNCYLEMQGTYYSPFVGGEGLFGSDGSTINIDDVSLSVFASADLVSYPDATAHVIDMVTSRAIDHFGDPDQFLNVSLPYKNTKWESVYYQPLIAKYFMQSYDIDKLDLVHIEDAKYPLNIDYNTTTGVTAYRINVGERTYTNYSMSEFNRNNNQSVMGPAGPCVVAHVPDLPNVFKGFDFLIGPELYGWDYINAAPVFNIRRASIALYGGNTYASRTNSVYISTSSLTQENEFVFGGDTYLSLLDYPNTMIFQLPDLDKWREKKYFIGSYIPFESSINMNLFHGDLVHRTYMSGFNQLDPYLQLEPTQMGLFHVLDMPYFVYNSVYSTLNTGKFYVPNSMYAEENLHYANRILCSQAKTTNEVIDLWAKFRVGDYLDVDNQWGTLTNLKVFKDKLFYFQDTGVGIAAVNERSMITDDNSNLITLGTGGILSRYDYVTNMNGSSIINDKTIVTSDNVLYWYDCDKNEICAYNGQVNQLSKEKQVLSYFNKNIREDRTKGMALFDKKYNEVWFNILDKPLVFNEQLGRFTSFYTFSPEWSLPISDRVVTIKDTYFHTLHDTGVNGLEPIDRKSKLEIVINKDFAYTKVFDNVRLLGLFKDANLESIKDDIIDYMKFITKHQEAVREHTEDKLDEEGNIITPGYHIITDYREDTFRFPIPRADKNEDTLSLPARLRGKYMICDYDLDSDIDHTFEIPQITTTYRHSLI